MRVTSNGEASEVTRPVTKEPISVAVRSVLICDARPGPGQAVARLAKNIPAAVDVAVVTDRFALSAAFAVKPADLVLIGLSPGSPDGAAATDQLLTQHPSANILVYGSVHDTDPCRLGADGPDGVAHPLDAFPVPRDR